MIIRQPLEQEHHRMTKRKFRSIVFAQWVRQALGVFVLISLVFIEVVVLLAHGAMLLILTGAAILDVALVFGIVRWSQLKHTKELVELERGIDMLSRSQLLKQLHPHGGSAEARELAAHINKMVRVVNEKLTLEQKQSEAKEKKNQTFVSRAEGLEEKMREAQLLREISDRISYSLNIAGIVEIIAGSIGSFIPHTSVSYVLLDADVLTFHIRLEEPVGTTYVGEVRKKMVDSFVELTGSEGIRTRPSEDIITGSPVDENSRSKLGSFFNGPLVIAGKTVGLLTVASTSVDTFTERQMNVLYTITNKVSSAVESLRGILEEEKGKLTAMVASISDGLVMVDTHSQVLVANPALKIILDLPLPELTLVDIVSKLHGSLDVQLRFQEALKLDRLIIADEIALGQLFVRPIFSPVRDKKGVTIGAVMILQNVTKERELQRLREDFISMMVHELRSPLGNVNKALELLEKGTVKSSEPHFKELITMVSKGTAGMLELVNDLLDVAKVEAGKFEIFKEETDIRELIRERLRSFALLAEDGKTTLNSNFGTAVPERINCDPRRIAQVLDNLLSNALKYTGAGGKIAVEVFLHRKDKSIFEEAKEASVNWYVYDSGKLNALSDALLIAVTDSGAGISADKLPLLFNKFQQLRPTPIKNAKGGTGLGLAVSKGIVEAHQGLIAAASEEGKGSTFYFTIPVTV